MPNEADTDSKIQLKEYIKQPKNEEANKSTGFLIVSSIIIMGIILFLFIVKRKNKKKK